MRCNFLFILVVALSCNLLAQTYHFDNYTVKDGLSQSTVYAMAQDASGYLWIGNRSGISRFDGIEFKNYSTKNGTAGNGARSLCIDSTGTIWFGHIGGGVTVYKDGSFTELKLDSNLASDISAIAMDDSGRIWISSASNGVYRINNPSAVPESSPDLDHFVAKHGISDRVFEIHKDAEGQLYFITDVGIRTYNPGLGEFEVFAPENLSTFFQITTIFVDSKGNTWYGTYNGGLYKQDASSGKFKIYDMRDGLAFNWISRIQEDTKGRIWAGTWGGGITVLEGDDMLTFNTENGLPDLKIFDIINDREGNVLIGSNETGLFIYKGDHFVAYTEGNGLTSDQVWAIEEDKLGRTWIGTSLGINILDDRGKETSLEFIREDHRFISDDVRFIKRDKNGNMWIGTIGGVISVDPDRIGGPYDYDGRLNSNIRFQLVTAMDIDKDNNLWVGTLEGLIYFEIDSRRMNYLTTYHGLAGNEISEIYCDDEGRIWIGCKGKGLTMIEDTSFTNIDLGGDITPNSIRVDNNGDLWVGTDGQGLMVSKDGKTITETFTTDDGLLADLINVLEVDDENHIWIGTNKGLCKFDRESNRFNSFTESGRIYGN